MALTLITAGSIITDCCRRQRVSSDPTETCAVPRAEYPSIEATHRLHNAQR
jgi:hypothetical protein